MRTCTKQNVRPGDRICRPYKGKSVGVTSGVFYEVLQVHGNTKVTIRDDDGRPRKMDLDKFTTPMPDYRDAAPKSALDEITAMDVARTGVRATVGLVRLPRALALGAVRWVFAPVKSLVKPFQYAVCIAALGGLTYAGVQTYSHHVHEPVMNTVESAKDLIPSVEVKWDDDEAEVSAE